MGERDGGGNVLEAGADLGGHCVAGRRFWCSSWPVSLSKSGSTMRAESALLFRLSSCRVCVMVRAASAVSERVAPVGFRLARVEICGLLRGDVQY